MAITIFFRKVFEIAKIIKLTPGHHCLSIHILFQILETKLENGVFHLLKVTKDLKDEFYPT
jgi:hypothetical protein